MAGRLEGKVAVITGGARGIGAGMVERFIAEGARCVISDIQREVGANFTTQFGDKAIFIQAVYPFEDWILAKSLVRGAPVAPGSYEDDLFRGIR